MEKTNRSSTIGFPGLLALIFITLKLLNLIKWSWIWVLSPVWIPLAFLFVLIIFAVIAAAMTNNN